MCELGSVSECKKVQSLRRLSILYNCRLVFSSGVLRVYPKKRARLCLFNMSSVFEWYV